MIFTLDCTKLGWFWLRNFDDTPSVSICCGFFCVYSSTWVADEHFLRTEGTACVTRLTYTANVSARAFSRMMNLLFIKDCCGWECNELAVHSNCSRTVLYILYII